MKNDRFLNGIVSGIGILILIALVLFFIRQQQAEYRPNDTPNNVVHNYILALLKQDYEQAFTYLADNEEKPSLAQFQQELRRSANEINRVSVTIGDMFFTDDTASVTLSMSQSYGGPITRTSWYTETAQLVRQNNAWKIISMPYPLWSWNWYYSETKPLP